MDPPFIPTLSADEKSLRDATGTIDMGTYVTGLAARIWESWNANISHYSHHRPLEERRATQTTEAIWRTIQRYAGEEIDDAIAVRQRKPDAIARAARNNIRLADAYYDAYYDGRDEIQPIVLYYGSLNLAKALSRVALGIGNVVGGHGVTVLKPELPIETAVLRLSTNGDFGLFVRALGAEPLPAEVDVSVFDLMRLIPELDGTMRQLSGVGTNAIRVYPHPERTRYQGDTTVLLVVDVPDPNDSSWVQQLVALPALVKRKAGPNWHARQISWRAPEGDGDADYRALTISGLASERYFERRLPGDIHIPPTAAMFAVQFYLSHLCRYRADEWLRTIDEHPREYSLVRDFMFLSESQLPNNILNELAQREYVFSSR